MKIIIDTGYNWGQEVWVWKLNKPVLAKIDRIIWQKDSIIEEFKYHLSCDDSDYYRYEEELFPTKEELMEAMSIKSIKIQDSEIKYGMILQCINSFTSIENDKYKKDFTICIVRVNHNSAIISTGNQSQRRNHYKLLYREEIMNNFTIHKIKTKGKIINDALRISNFEEETEEEEQ